MKLYSTLRSPYGRKIKIIAIEKQIQLDIIVEDLKSKSEELLKANPLGLVPTLITDDGEAIFDSVVIAEYIDNLNDRVIFIPEDITRRIESLKLSALADGITENAIAIFFERLRNENTIDQAKLSKHFANIERSLNYLEERVSEFSKHYDIAQVSIGCALGYLDFRFSELGWRRNQTHLANFYDALKLNAAFRKTEPKE